MNKAQIKAKKMRKAFRDSRKPKRITVMKDIGGGYKYPVPLRG